MELDAKVWEEYEQEGSENAKKGVKVSNHITELMRKRIYRHFSHVQRDQVIFLYHKSDESFSVIISKILDFTTNIFTTELLNVSESGYQITS